ncbi:MAG: ATP-dependent DNA helicase [Synergistaceae bacterium]|nr:ATP-dependent DNA helicase [Synergistaceae bacterium]
MRNAAQKSFALEAPTGVGKTFAVLVPALREASRAGRRILFLTAGIALQEQLIEKDLPRLRELLGIPFAFGLLKGRSNYVCLRQARSVDRTAPLFAEADVSRWLEETETGDLAELELPPSSPVRQALAAGRNCLGARCPFRGRCFILQTYRNAQEWDLLVANYSLYFSHLLEGSGNFPVRYDWLICDEAHRLAGAVREASAVRVGAEAGRTLFGKKTLQGFSPFLKSQAVDLAGLSDHAERAGEELRGLFEALPSRLPENVLQEPDADLLRRGRVVAGELDGMLRPLRSVEDRLSAGDVVDRAVWTQGAELIHWIEDVRSFQRSLLWCLSAERFPKWAYWAEAGGPSAVPALMSKPVDAGEILQGVLDREEPEKMVFASATLTLSGKLDFWSRETGVVPDVSLSVSSPFDFQRQMEVLVVKVGLRVTEAGYDERMCRVMERLCDENGGRTLVLLSSLRLMRAFARRMRDPEAGGRPYSVLVQGELPQRQLLQRFIEDETSILIGSAAFREGVDVPGEGLTQVIIDRIPFPHPNDPIVRARDAVEEGRGFFRFSLPMARMFLRQAAGRLIRGSSDHGRVVLLDDRALERRAWDILSSFPPCRVRRLEVRDGGPG